MATKYIGPNGDGGVNGSGSSGSPYKLWSTALAALSSGDELIALDGTYTTSANGNLSDTSGTRNNITIAADNLLGAIVTSDGTQHTMRINSSSGWWFEGLVFKNAEKLISAGGIQSQTLYWYECSGFTAYKCIFQQNNNAENTHHIQAWSPNTGAGGHLVEQCEFYNYNRHGVIFTKSNNNRMRLCYCNGGDEPDVTGGFHSVSYNSTGGAVQTGDFGGAAYPASGNIFESNIFEKVWMGSSIQATGVSSGNTFIGNIDIDCYYGHVSGARGNSRTLAPQNTVIKHQLSLRPYYYGTSMRACENVLASHISVFDETGQALIGVISDRDASNAGDPTYYSTYIDHVSVVALGSAIGRGVYVTSQIAAVEWGINYANAYNTTTPFEPSSSNGQGTIANTSTVDPQFGDIRLWIPNGDNGTNTSPLSGAGANGSDIGATILYAYENGVLTSDPLWDASTGAWLYALPEVSGVNDSAGAKAGDVHERITPVGGRGVFPSTYSEPIPANDPTVTASSNPKSVTAGSAVLVGGTPGDVDGDLASLTITCSQTKVKTVPVSGVTIVAS